MNAINAARRERDVDFEKAKAETLSSVTQVRAAAEAQPIAGEVMAKQSRAVAGGFLAESVSNSAAAVAASATAGEWGALGARARACSRHGDRAPGLPKLKFGVPCPPAAPPGPSQARPAVTANPKAVRVQLER